jgi:hypothetical protein
MSCMGGRSSCRSFFSLQVLENNFVFACPSQNRTFALIFRCFYFPWFVCNVFLFNSALFLQMGTFPPAPSFKCNPPFEICFAYSFLGKIIKSDLNSLPIRKDCSPWLFPNMYFHKWRGRGKFSAMRGNLGLDHSFLPSFPRNEYGTGNCISMETMASAVQFDQRFFNAYSGDQ